MKHCGTKEQVTDIKTKALPLGKHEYFRSHMGVTNFEERESVESHPSKQEYTYAMFGQQDFISNPEFG